MRPIQWFMRVYVAKSVVHEIYGAEYSVVREGLCGRVRGSRGSMWSLQWFMRIYVSESVDLLIVPADCLYFFSKVNMPQIVNYSL